MLSNRNKDNNCVVTCIQYLCVIMTAMYTYTYVYVPTQVSSLTIPHSNEIIKKTIL